MALLWVEGFEKYGAGGACDPLGVLNMKYLTDGTPGTAAGRDSGLSIYTYLTFYQFWTPLLDVSGDTLIVGFAFKLTGVADGTQLVDFRNTKSAGNVISYSNLWFSVESINSANEIAINISNTQVATSNGVDIRPNTWYYFEAKVKAAASGTINVALDGVVVASYSGSTTYYGEGYSRLRFSPMTSDYMYIDDLYVCDGSGNTNNDFLGDCKVETLSPTSDVSNSWTPSSGNDGYAMVSEDVLDTSNYISETASSNQALFGLGSLSANATGDIVGVMVSCESEQSGNIYKYAKAVTQNGTSGNVTESGVFQPGKDATISSTIVMAKDSEGNDWTSSTVNTLRVGVKVS